ncbi:MAG: hypothetical protein JST33_01605 [Actinobacteria bacterium]|nr:hypothetical protein [Actinomycetota bacterium]
MIGRLLIGLQAARGEVDPWGPMDAFVIVGGLVCWSGAAWLLVRADVHARIAAEIAHWQIVDVHGNRVAANGLRVAARSARTLRRWLIRRRARVIPIAALAARDRRSQLLIAARGRLGTTVERRASFGEGIASRYAHTVRRLRRTAGAVIALEVSAGAIAIGGVVSGGGTSPFFRIGAAVFLLIVLLSPIIGRTVRRGPDGLRALAAELLPSLQIRDTRLDLNRIAAMIVKPRLHDLWAELHPVPRARLGSEKGAAQGGDRGAIPIKRPRCRS